MNTYQITDTDGQHVATVTASSHRRAAFSISCVLREGDLEAVKRWNGGNMDTAYGLHFYDPDSEREVVVTDVELATDTRPEPELVEGDDDEPLDMHTGPIHAKPLMPAEPIDVYDGLVREIHVTGRPGDAGIVIRRNDRRKWREPRRGSGTHFTVIRRVMEGEHAGKFELRLDTGRQDFATLMELATRSVPSTEPHPGDIDEGPRAHMDPLAAAHRLADVVSHELTQFTARRAIRRAALRAALADFREATR